MDGIAALVLTGLLGAALGGLVGALAVAGVLPGRYAARLAAAVAERDVLRERVIDLEATVADGAQTAALVTPLADSLRRMELQVAGLERDRHNQFGAVSASLEQVATSTHALGAQTASLAGSLRSSSVRGAWGEVHLRRVLELSGLVARCDFDEQVTAVNSAGDAVRPDVVVRLPGDRHLVIDAKAPMTSFLDAQAADLTPERRRQLFTAHADALRAHVDALAGKQYWSAVASTPEVVIAFVPNEAILAAALAADPALHEHALARRVALASPATLLAMLRSVALTWQQDAVTDRAAEVLSLARELHERLTTLAGHTEALGRSLRRSVESYNAFVGSLENRVLVTARRLGDLGPPVPPAEPVEVAPRPLTAAELIDAVGRDPDREPSHDLLREAGLHRDDRDRDTA